MTEFNQKQDRIQTLLAGHNLEAMLLKRVSSFAWATCGAASYVNMATTEGAASLLFTPAGRYLITNNIEATRLEREEKLTDQGWEFRVGLWHQMGDQITELTRGLKLGADGPYPGATDLSAVVGEVLLSTPAQSIAGGTDEIQRNIIGERVLGLPGEPRLDKDLSWRDVPR